MIYLNQYIESSVGQPKNSSQIFKFHVDEGLDNSQCIYASANTSVCLENGTHFNILPTVLCRILSYHVADICNIFTVLYCIVLWNVHTNMREREWHNGPNQFHSLQLKWWGGPFTKCIPVFSKWSLLLLSPLEKNSPLRLALTQWSWQCPWPWPERHESSSLLWQSQRRGQFNMTISYDHWIWPSPEGSHESMQFKMTITITVTMTI